MERVIHRATGRGVVDQGWLKSYHTFSYGNYYDPRRIHFGALRILNDNTIEGGEGHGSHTHDNMEIITIPLEGALEHGDNIGNISVLSAGEIQVLTAGTGIVHNEYNKSQTSPVRFFQIWIYPGEYELQPAYSQVDMPELKPDELTMIVAPYGEDDDSVAHISQQAWLYVVEFTGGGPSVTHTPHSGNYGTYIFVVEGEVSVGETTLNPGDGMGIWDTDSITMSSESPSKVLVIEVPMKK